MSENTKKGIVRVFIDAENIRIGLKDFNEVIDYEVLMWIMQKHYQGAFTSFAFYVPRANPTMHQTYDNWVNLVNILNRLGYRVVECSNNQEVDNCIFQDIIISTNKVLPFAHKYKIDTGKELPINLVLFSGDNDFHPALSAVKGLGKSVKALMGIHITVISFSPVISPLLKKIADEYIDLRKDPEFSQAIFRHEDF